MLRICARLLVLCLLLVGCAPALPNSKESSGLRGGFIMDNGGDQISCCSTAGSPFSGDYTLDYVLTWNPVLGTSAYPEFATWEAYRDRMVANLQAKLPAAAVSLRNYLADFLVDDETRTRVWKPSELDLIDLGDEQIVQELPANCTRASGTGSGQVADLRQLVRRREFRPDDGSPGRVYFYYDQARMNRMRSERPLQFSYLAIHEWIWEFTDSAWVNRTINNALQTRAVDDMSGDELRSYLRSLGIPDVSQGGLQLQSPAERAMRESFAQDPLCRFDQRYAVDFVALAPTVTVASGQTQSLRVELPRELPNMGARICGMALVMTVEGAGGGGSGSVDVTLRRGFASHATRLGGGEQILTSRCLDRMCVERNGVFQDMLTVASMPGSRWTLELAAPAGRGVRVVRPQLVFVSMAE